MNEQFVNELAVALRKVGTIHTVGEEWHSYTGEIPVGGVPYTGQMVVRSTYSALWSYAQERGLVKTEAEWQQIASANGGNVPYYSDGDGSTTFRMPKIVGYVKGASSQSESGNYIAEGLPNITGSFEGRPHGAGSATYGGALIQNATGAFETILHGGVGSCNGVAETSTKSNNDIVNFNASMSNPIYGNSIHVTPETTVVMFGVYAFGVVTNADELDVSAIARDASDAKTDLARVESDITALMETVSRIEANSGGVTQKHESSGTLTNAQTVLKKLTDLTPYKPLFVYVVKTNEISGVITVSDMTNVIGEEASQFEVTPAFVSKVHCLQYHFIPTDTSVSMRLLCNTNSTTPCSYTVHVYQ